MSKLLYFAYGSNLHPHWLQSRTPSAEILGTVICPNLNLHFHKGGVDDSGKCNIVRSESADDVIHGAVYQFDAHEKEVLDIAEDGYHEESLDLGEFKNVLVYIAKEGIDDDLSPYSWYQDIVIAGAQLHGFPQQYITHIQSFSAITDPDQEREKRHRSIVWPAF
jgi:gamma-glutamyl AIG2-like cyclotransferase